MDLPAPLSSLPLCHRQVLVLREVQGRSYDEIAGILRISRDDVARRLTAARRELCDRLNWSRAGSAFGAQGDREVPQ
jgi:DNA-directed RNA polymerase specialized sigma24 family protein